MRVSQIQNLTWAGNVLVLGGVVWVGLQFWQMRNAKPAAEPTWAKAKTDDVGKQRWPGDRTAFDDIQKTPLNGKVPPPPTKGPELVKLDRTAEFKGKLKYLTGLLFPDTPEMSLARVSYDGKELWIQPGDDVGGSGFRLVEFALVPAKAPAAAGGTPSVSALVRLTFRSPEGDKPVVVEQQDPQGKPLVEEGKGLVERVDETAGIKRGRVPEAGPLARLSFQATNGDWIITDDEQQWLEEWSEKDLWPNLGAEPRLDQAGNPHGLRITSLPEPKTPLAPSHGIYVNDVVRSINGVAVNSKEEILEYLRGPGRGLYAYKVVVETNGAERTIVYRVPTPARASRD